MRGSLDFSNVKQPATIKTYSLQEPTGPPAPSWDVKHLQLTFRIIISSVRLPLNLFSAASQLLPCLSSLLLTWMLFGFEWLRTLFYVIVCMVFLMNDIFFIVLYYGLLLPSHVHTGSDLLSWLATVFCICNACKYCHLLAKTNSDTTTLSPVGGSCNTLSFCCISQPHSSPYKYNSWNNHYSKWVPFACNSPKTSWGHSNDFTKNVYFLK